MNKKDFLPIVVASVIALVITGIVRWLIPSGAQQTSNQQNTQNGISMPEIPLMVTKEEKKKKIIEYSVLVVSKGIKKDTKISIDFLEWKKWPSDAMQSYFIAKDENETPLNNGSDYNNALKMWANTDIPSGVPLTMAMLSNEDPVKKAKEEKARLAEEKRKKEEKERTDAFIKKGMRAVTFSIDQKSASSSNMLEPGDLVDVLIMEQKGDRMRTHKYKALKILAIDGITKFEKKSDEKSQGGLLGNMGLRTVGGLLTPKNITLEVKEEMVEKMLKQAANTGVILSLRSQSEKIENENNDDEIVDSEGSPETTSVLSKILNINRTDLTDVLQEEKNRKEIEERNLEILMNNINMVNNIEDSMLEKSKMATTDKTQQPNNTSSGDENSGEGKYEVISGKIIGEEPKQEKELDSVIVYRKLTPSAVQFNEEGKIVNVNGSSANMFEPSVNMTKLR